MGCPLPSRSCRDTRHLSEQRVVSRGPQTPGIVVLSCSAPWGAEKPQRPDTFWAGQGPGVSWKSAHCRRDVAEQLLPRLLGSG